MNRVVALLSAGWFSCRYSAPLKIRWTEASRYLRKSLSLALCYSGFSLPGAPRQAWKAGKAAFLSCAYDVVTDWRGFEPSALEIFKGILATEVRPEIANIALELYEKDACGKLDEDGLERGALAFRFVTRLIGSEEFFARRIDIDNAGRLWQLVDDVLDYDDDLLSGDVNCLCSANRDLYLQRVDQLMQEPFASLFLKDRVLAYVAQRSMKLTRAMVEGR